ncbi:MAG: DUF2304 domain-containing protein [Erysipelotrichaceae bacterium]|nr:DUF2304 domain-containing protein [Erysipelotrichaceae bacterium]
MSTRTHLILILMTVFFFWVLLRGMKKSRLSTDIAVLWVGFLFLLVVLSIFPQFSALMAEIMGIKTVINAVFLVIIFLLICMVFFLCLQVSVLNERVKNLVQEISLAETRTSHSEDKTAE